MQDICTWVIGQAVRAKHTWSHVKYVDTVGPGFDAKETFPYVSWPIVSAIEAHCCDQHIQCD